MCTRSHSRSRCSRPRSGWAAGSTLRSETASARWMCWRWSTGPDRAPVRRRSRETRRGARTRTRRRRSLPLLSTNLRRRGGTTRSRSCRRGEPERRRRGRDGCPSREDPPRAVRAGRANAAWSTTEYRPAAAHGPRHPSRPRSLARWTGPPTLARSCGGGQRTSGMRAGSPPAGDCVHRVVARRRDSAILAG